MKLLTTKQQVAQAPSDRWKGSKLIDIVLDDDSYLPGVYANEESAFAMQVDNYHRFIEFHELPELQNRTISKLLVLSWRHRIPILGQYLRKCWAKSHSVRQPDWLHGFERGARIASANMNYINLWMYFENRGAGVKNTMFSVVTWIIGFAAIVFGYSVTEFINFKVFPPKVLSPSGVIIVGLIGILIVWYALVLIRDFGDHIQINFDRADRTREGDLSLDEILAIDGPKLKYELPKISKRVRRIVWFFGIVFVASILFATVEIFTGSNDSGKGTGAPVGKPSNMQIQSTTKSGG